MKKRIKKYQKIKQLLENEINEPSKFGAKIGIKINDVACGMYYCVLY